MYLIYWLIKDWVYSILKILNDIYNMIKCMFGKKNDHFIKIKKLLILCLKVE